LVCNLLPVLYFTMEPLPLTRSS